MDFYLYEKEASAETGYHSFTTIVGIQYASSIIIR
jgi:hypothetical protein